jgi:hypothetical protein
VGCFVGFWGRSRDLPRARFHHAAPPYDAIAALTSRELDKMSPRVHRSILWSVQDEDMPIDMVA